MCRLLKVCDPWGETIYTVYGRHKGSLACLFLLSPHILPCTFEVKQTSIIAACAGTNNVFGCLSITWESHQSSKGAL